MGFSQAKVAALYTSDRQKGVKAITECDGPKADIMERPQAPGTDSICASSSAAWVRVRTFSLRKIAVT